MGKNKRKTLLNKEYINTIFNYIKDNSDITFDDIITEFGITQHKLYNRLYSNYNDLIPPQSDLDNYRKLYKLVCENSNVNKVPEEKKKIKKEIVYDASENKSFDDRSIGISIKDLEGNITGYKFKILIRDNKPFEGILTLSEMQDIYVGYSSRGYNLSAKKLCQKFPQYDLIQIKRILRAFKITKDCYPFAPHIIEHSTKEELERMLLDLKIYSASKNADRDELKEKDAYILKLTKEISDLKNKEYLLNNLIKSSEINIESNFHNRDLNIENNINNTLIIYLSDLHIGAYNPKFGFIKLEDYNTDEIKRRLNKVIDLVRNNYNFDKIIICNLGDSIDSYNGTTTRGHELPICMSNKEMSIMYLNIMSEFFENLTLYINPNDIYYYCVGESNHDGDFGWINNIALSYKLNNIGIKCKISNNPIDKFDVGNNSILFLHGKDIESQFKGMPLILDNKTINWFNDYIYDSNLEFKDNIYIIKGDLHQYAITMSKRFKYISVPSLYGSSNYIVSNFGKTDWGVTYMIVDNNNYVTTGLINDKC